MLPDFKIKYNFFIDYEKNWNFSFKLNHLAAQYYTLSPKTSFENSFFAPFFNPSLEIL
jgi:hypothetical protein